MRFSLALIGLLLLTGCAGSRTGTSQYDIYDAVIVDQMVGNNVSGAVLQRTVVCLNARRETRPLTAVTNISVTVLTNQTITPVTNYMITLSTNLQVTSMTNAAPPGPLQPVPEAVTTPAETNQVVALTNAGPVSTTNVTVALATNQSLVIAPNQTAANTQISRNFNNQITTTSNNLSISLMTNQVVTSETNTTITFSTNISLISLTNVVITPTNTHIHDFYLYTELAPTDIALQSGESMTLVLDGVRYGFNPVTPAGGLPGRKGYTTTLFRAAPEVFVAIANARDARLRLRTSTGVIERSLSKGSREHFKEFLVTYFKSEQAPVTPAPKAKPPAKKKSPAPKSPPSQGAAAQTGSKSQS